MKPKFKSTQNGLEIVDPIEHHHCQLITDTPVIPAPVSNDSVPFPIDTAVEITTQRVVVQHNNGVFIRDSDGILITEVGVNDYVTLPQSEYTIDVSESIKIYITVRSKLKINCSATKTELLFERPCSATLSARSLHQRPAETITTTPKPTDVMEAVSLFGSAIKTTDPGRSYPTLRGHPPAVTLGDKLKIPDSLNRPDTDIHIAVPPTLSQIFAVAPLAYYLKATIVHGTTPHIAVGDDFSYKLMAPGGFESAVEQVLKKILLLDCILRTEGTTPLPLYERQALESVLEFDIPSTYDQSANDRLQTYLEVPFEKIRPHLPEWHPEIQVLPTEDHIEFLPFIVNNLTVIKTGSEETYSAQTPQSVIQHGQKSDYIIRQRDNKKGCNKQQEPTSAVLKGIPTAQKVWENSTGDVITSTRTLSSFRNGIDQSPREGDLKITVICNGEGMERELVNAYSEYNGRNDLSIDITVRHNVSTEDLQSILGEQNDFIHYIGHIDSDGFRCSNGRLDGQDIKTVEAKAFFLNACESYEQGISLIEAGSIGGIVTTTEVQNSTAVTVGSTIAQLLNAGLPLYTTLYLLQEEIEDSSQYHILGEETLSVSETVNGDRIIIVITVENGEIALSVNSFISTVTGIGGVFSPFIEGMDLYHLFLSKVDLGTISKPRLIEFLNTGKCPVLFNGELRWSNDIKTSEL